MATEYLRDGVFLIAWFGLMTCVWFGWAQEAPPKGAARWLGVGSGLGIVAALAGGLLLWRVWATPSALEGQYPVFGLLVLAEVAVAAIACLVLWRRGRKRWFSLAVGLVVAVHFVPLGILLDDAGLIVLGLVQTVLVIVAARVAHNKHRAPSFTIGVAMGVTLLMAVMVAGVRWVPEALSA
ncbi:hypothetical protein SCB71_13605 [Herbiconiux sp. KACC 21604]|uniref:hypothetical protein n=1 Tax=unclassified Herbiconiux TaxID=2618217 RepID=UPI0014925934|nr:hypothetical protein [Herbiconiux sp. SALV-R1]QJU54194.1 hypothetical protein HL652_11555 [Herbiconiux sp. SALV-R1]WPO85248.1 hypothetical protein SCB71_13605 [Herbiconiux sp. KACC 21604]